MYFALISKHNIPFPMYAIGSEINRALPSLVIEFLKSRSIEKINLSPKSLNIFDHNGFLMLRILNGTEKIYPIRKTFLYKLFRWHSFPLAHLYKLTYPTIIALSNDFLQKIKRDEVVVKLENNEALTILSTDYNELSDLDVLHESANLDIRSVSRNDFFMSIQTTDKAKVQPVPGDFIGVSINILNSETGFRALSISHYLLRYMCTNGAVAAFHHTEAKKYHYGKFNLKQFLHDRVAEADANHGPLISKLNLLVTTPIKKPKSHYLSTIEPLLGKKDAERILAGFDNLESMYDLFNLITSHAQQFDLSRRHYLESVAGKLL